MPAYSYPSPPTTGSDGATERQFSTRGQSVESLRQRLVGTNINEQTFLATDYLNHFNEIEMLIEMLPSMPECFEDICQWQPKTYESHFADSGFRDKDLAILAYQRAPDLVRKHFDETISRLERCIIDAIESLKETFEIDAPKHLGVLSEQFNVELRHHIDRASAIINGHHKVVATDTLATGTSTTSDSIEKTQAAVEELFGD
jgi:hypothetical protein